MEVPKKILVDVGSEGKPDINGRTNHYPAGYFSDSDDYDDDYEDYPPPRLRHEPIATVKSPPEKLTLPLVTEEERTRFLRENSLIVDGGHGDESVMFKTPNDSVLKNMTSFQSGDPVSLARQVRHLHNRVKLLEEELSTQHNRQIFLFGILSVYILSKGFKWMCR